MLVRVDRFQINEAAADHLGNAGTEDQKRYEIKECCPNNRDTRAEYTRRDNGRDRVRGIVHAIRLIEDQGNRNNEYNQDRCAFHNLNRSSLIMFEDDAFDDVPDALASIGGVFQDLVKILPLDDVNGIRIVLE